MKANQTTAAINRIPVRKKAARLTALALALVLLMGHPVTGHGTSPHAQKTETGTAVAKLSSEAAAQQLKGIK
ncbi:hypothetical protein [Anoxynatronum sibiricum]|uniref:Uncharacterized protein n=1 Tax=Anoxynatronum sibiricum TaxID=210623 RepID=A0ABU9VWS3_9CLOT